MFARAASNLHPLELIRSDEAIQSAPSISDRRQTFVTDNSTGNCKLHRWHLEDSSQKLVLGEKEQGLPVFGIRPSIGSQWTYLSHCPTLATKGEEHIFLEIISGEVQDALCSGIARIQPTESLDVLLLHRIASHLRRCIKERQLVEGRRVHQLVIGYGLESNTMLGSHLIHFFALFECLPEATQVFCKIHKPQISAWSEIIFAHLACRQNEEALRLYQHLRATSLEPNCRLLCAVLKACTSVHTLDQGMRIHSHLVESGLDLDAFIASNLIQMYARCGVLKDASIVFSRLPRQDVTTWNPLITVYAQHNYSECSLCLLKGMVEETFTPDCVTLVVVLKACANMAALNEGACVHELVIETGLEADVFVGSALVDMYAKAGSLMSAQVTFDRLVTRNLVTWSALIAGYVHHSYSVDALRVFAEMQKERLHPSTAILTSVLKACSNVAFIDLGMYIHTLVIEDGVDLDDYIRSTLIDMYIKHGQPKDAGNVFNGSKTRNVVIWSSLISAHTGRGEGHEALEIFGNMQQEGIRPNLVTMACVLKACASIGALQIGRFLHSQIVGDGFVSDVFLNISLIDMYAKCGSLQDASFVFNSLSRRHVVAWSALLTGYAQQQQWQEVFGLFREMQNDGVNPDPTACVSILKACSDTTALRSGQQIHAVSIENGFEVDAFVGSALIDMYSSCGSLKEASIVFEKLSRKTSIIWNSMIACYGEHSNYPLMLTTFREMQESCEKPDGVTFLCIFSACSNARLVDEGCGFFQMMRDDYDIMPSLEHLNCMVRLFAEASCSSEAEDLLETIPFSQNVVGWMSLLSACRMHGLVEIGERSFNYVVLLDSGKGAAYVLMSHIYTIAGMHDDARRVDGLRNCANRWKKPAKCHIEIDNKVHNFTVGDTKHTQHVDIFEKIRQLQQQLLGQAVIKPRIRLKP